MNPDSPNVITAIKKNLYTQHTPKYLLYVPNISITEETELAMGLHRFISIQNNLYYSHTTYGATPVCQYVYDVLKRKDFVLSSIHGNNFFL